MVTTPMKNNHVSRESNQGSRSQKILKKSKMCEQPKHFVDTSYNSTRNDVTFRIGKETECN